MKISSTTSSQGGWIDAISTFRLSWPNLEGSMGVETSRGSDDGNGQLSMGGQTMRGQAYPRPRIVRVLRLLTICTPFALTCTVLVVASLVLQCGPRARAQDTVVAQQRAATTIRQ